MVDWMMWKPLPSGSRLGVEQRQDAAAAGSRAAWSQANGAAARPAATPRPMMTFHDRPARKITKKPAAKTRMAVPRSGWRAISATGISSSSAATGIVAQAQHGLVLLEIPGQHQRHGDLHQLGRLDAHEAEIEPAPRALGDVAEQRHGDQQQHADDIHRQRQVHQPLRRNLRGDAHHHQRHGDVDELRR